MGADKMTLVTRFPEMDGYSPTPSEEKMLTVLLNPLYDEMTITEKCKVAGISRRAYYDMMNKGEFIRYKKHFMLKVLDLELMPILHAFIKEAKAGSFRHGELLLKMAGLYTDKVQIDSRSVTLVVDGRDVSSMDDEELRKAAQKYGIVTPGDGLKEYADYVEIDDDE